MGDGEDYEIFHDAPYTDELNTKVREQYGPAGQRSATHVSDLLYCLRKAWGKRNLPADQQEVIDDETLLTWTGGLQFEALVSEGEKQSAMAYCFQCELVYVTAYPDEVHCYDCGERWLVGTPDYIVDGIVHEVKQTRKSRRRGPDDAPWWVEQVKTYHAFEKLAGNTEAPYARLVVNWLMGDYGSKRKGEQPRPPRSTLDAFRVVFSEGYEKGWLEELKRRKEIVEGEEMPPLTGFDPDARSPAYGWECDSCPVGLALNCEMFKWSEDGKIREDTEGEGKEEIQNDA